MYRKFNPTAGEYIIILNAYGTYAKIDCVLSKNKL